MSKIIIKQAKSKEYLNLLFALRYKTYCKELHWLEPQDYSDKLEKDKFDQYSIHFGAFLNNKAIGNIRLILTNPSGLPIEELCKDRLLLAINGNMNNVAEISRLIIDKSDNLLKYNDVLLALIKQVYYAGKYKVKIPYLSAIFDAFVYRLIRMTGFRFSSLIKEPVNYMGSKSYPAIISINEFDENAIKNNLKLYNYLNSEESQLYCK